MKKIHNRKSKKRSRKNILDGGDDINISIRDFEGKRYEISVNTDDTIKQLIEKCKEKSPIDKEFQYILALGGKILSEKKPISEYGIKTESTLDLMKKLPPPVVGMWVVGNYNYTVFLYENETGIIISNISSRINSKYIIPNIIYNNVVWKYNKVNNILKIKVEFGEIREVSPSYHNWPIETKYGEIWYVNMREKISHFSAPNFLSSGFYSLAKESYTEKPKEPKINLETYKLTTFIREDRYTEIKQLTLQDPMFENTIQNIIVSPDIKHMNIFENIIKVLRYMDKGIYYETLNFDNIDNMKKSISLILSNKFLHINHGGWSIFDLYDPKLNEILKTSSLSHIPYHGEKYKELMKIINRIPEMDIF